MWTPLRVHVVCENGGRTKACPALLRGFIDDASVLAYSPRADAELVIFVNAVVQANDDLILMRFVAALAGAPPNLEIVERVPTRASDDEQMAILKRAFVRGVAPFVGARMPEAVRTELVPLPPGLMTAPTMTPWGWELLVSGSWNWSGEYQSADASGLAGLSRTTRHSIGQLALGGFYGQTRSPALIDMSTGKRTSLDTELYGLRSKAITAWNLSEAVATGAILRIGTEDPFGRYRATGRLTAALSLDRFPADDPRGNELGAAYLLGVQVDRYNVRNERGEEGAAFPTQGFIVAASVRHDVVQYRLNLSALSQIDAAWRLPSRLLMAAAGHLQFQLGNHADLTLDLAVTRQIAPGPDKDSIDPSNFQQLSRLQYAEPLRLSSAVTLRLHFDRSNTDRNNRFRWAAELSELSTL